MLFVNFIIYKLGQITTTQLQSRAFLSVNVIRFNRVRQESQFYWKKDIHMEKFIHKGGSCQIKGKAYMSEWGRRSS